MSYCLICALTVSWTYNPFCKPIYFTHIFKKEPRSCNFMYFLPQVGPEKKNSTNGVLFRHPWNLCNVSTSVTFTACNFALPDTGHVNLAGNLLSNFLRLLMVFLWKTYQLSLRKSSHHHWQWHPMETVGFLICYQSSVHNVFDCTVSN
jgi:hypothetical protein